MAWSWGGAGSGAASGAAAGSSFGPWGTAIGGTIGAVTGGLGAGQKKDKFRQISALTPEGQKSLADIFNQLNMMQQPGGTYAQSQDYLSKLLSGDPQAYERFAAPYIQNFEQQILPRLGEKFAGIGGGLGGGAGSSSGFAQALGGASGQLQAQLAGLYAQLQQQAAQQAMGQYGNLANLGLGTRAFETTYQPGSTGVMGGLQAGLAQGFGQKAGQRMGSGQGFDWGNWFNSLGNKPDVAGPYGEGQTYNPYTDFQG